MGIARLRTCLPADPGTYLWVDPSARSGAFLSQLPSPRVGFDLAPADFESRQADFLDWAPPEGFPRHIVVGNPPWPSAPTGGRPSRAFGRGRGGHCQVDAVALAAYRTCMIKIDVPPLKGYPASVRSLILRSA